MLSNLTIVIQMIKDNTNAWCNTCNFIIYTILLIYTNLQTQLIYSRTNSTQKGILFFPRQGTGKFFSEFIFTRSHINMTISCVLDVSELT